MSTKFGFAIGAILISLCGLRLDRAFGTTPPENYLFKDAVGTAQPIDPALEAWFRQYAEVKNPLELDEKAFESYLNQLSPTARALLKLRFVYGSLGGAGSESIYAESMAQLQKTLQASNDASSQDPLVPYLAEELLTSPNLTTDKATELSEVIRKYGDQSCPAKDQLLRDIDDEKAKTLSFDAAKAILSRIQAYHSSRYRQEALTGLLDILPAELKEPLRQPLLEAVKPFSKLLDDNLWLLGNERQPSEDEQIATLAEPSKSFAMAEKEARHRRCTTAKSFFLKGLNKIKGQTSFEEAEASVLKLDSCFRSRGLPARLRFWRGVQGPLEKAFGFAGAEIAMRRRGLIAWGQDQFDEARGIFKSLLERSRKESNKTIEASALYTYGRIEENAGSLKAAIKLLEEFVDHFPEDEHVDEATMSLALLEAMTGKTMDALQRTDKLVEKQTILGIDARSTTTLSFALFWSGRLYYRLGKKAKAEEYWRRLASEYYSTYYGALGHYMLEKMIGKPLLLAPARTATFDESKIFKSLSSANQRGAMRVKGLLKLGMKDEASCELTELVVKTSSNDQVLAKTMLEYAAGDWLLAIKNFGDLPRSYRGSLALGMERILFPRAYDEQVTKYAKKLGVDADYIFAIIRQESVFNPRALSPVGARGLMQLMPQTAKSEARRLGRDYLPKKKRRELLRHSRDRSRLFDAETNLALGVHHAHRLMERYKSPIFVLTAYNASPKATERWMANIDSDDILAFIERIPYAETRAYVKLVLRNYFYYKRWYRAPNTDMPHFDMVAKSVFGDRFAKANH